MVGPNGLEPSTSSVSRKRSNQLSYGPTLLNDCGFNSTGRQPITATFGSAVLGWIKALASDGSRGFRGICSSSGRFVPWNMQRRQVVVVASLGE